MNWFQASKDLLAIAIAALAVVVSLVTVILQRRQQQRQAYREIYSALMSEDLHRGRRLINGITEANGIPKDGPDSLLIFRTLGLFNNLAMYGRLRVVPRKWVLDVWHHPLREMERGADIIRRETAGKYEERGGALSPWPQLWTLFGIAEIYRSRFACCRPDGGLRARIRQSAALWFWRAPKQSREEGGGSGPPVQGVAAPGRR